MYKRKMLRAAVGVCICTAWIFGTATAFAAGQAETVLESGGPGEIKVHDEEKAHNQLEGADQLILVKGTGAVRRIFPIMCIHRTAGSICGRNQGM